MRAIVAQADFTDQPLAELKAWLAITGTRDDALLAGLLATAAVLCEGFTGVFALPTTVAERIDASTAWQALSARPVQRIVTVAALAGDFSRRMLLPGAFETEPGPDGTVLLRLTAPIAESQLEVTLEAGLADTWATLDPGLRQGVVRLAAHHYRMRDAATQGDPPAAIAALWRPWRRLRL